VVEQYTAYARARVAEGHRLRNMVRHLHGLYTGLPNVRPWRRFISEQSAQPQADPGLLLDALRILRVA
jgi:tRNA-dihydrouridine synthase A